MYILYIYVCIYFYKYYYTHISFFYLPSRLTLFIKCSSLSPVMLLTFKPGFSGSLQDVSLFSEILTPQILASWVALNSNKFFFFFPCYETFKSSIQVPSLLVAMSYLASSTLDPKFLMNQQIHQWGNWGQRPDSYSPQGTSLLSGILVAECLCPAPNSCMQILILNVKV